jgi:hypothetical protein
LKFGENGSGLDMAEITEQIWQKEVYRHRLEEMFEFFRGIENEFDWPQNHSPLTASSTDDIDATARTN